MTNWTFIDNLCLSAAEIHDYILDPRHSLIIIDLMIAIKTMDVATARMLFGATRDPIILLEVFTQYLIEVPNSQILRVLIEKLPCYSEKTSKIFLTDQIVSRLNELFLQKAIQTLRHHKLGKTDAIDNWLRKKFSNKEDKQDNIIEHEFL